MHLRSMIVAVFIAALVGACHLWPEDLDELASTISEQVSGEATAWRVGGNVVVINVTHSPFYFADKPELEALAMDIARLGIEATSAPLESLVITFYEDEISDDEDSMRDFVFLVSDGQPVLHTLPDHKATGPLTREEIQAQSLDLMGDALNDAQRACALNTAVDLAQQAGDPENLDPTTVNHLPVEHWDSLDAFGKRIILLQLISTQAMFDCIAQ